MRDGFFLTVVLLVGCAPTAPVPSVEPTKAPKPEPLPEITNSIGMQLKVIPAGSFLMGSSYADTSYEEKPQHLVRITKPFLLGVYPITQAEYKAVTASNPSHFKRDARCPVESVSWFDAIDFCNRLSERDGFSPYYGREGHEVSILGGNGYRLPTEAEWEYACRAGSTTKWCCGDDHTKLEAFAWFADNSGYQTHPVGEKQPNQWGLYDMPGNVWEWCWDWFDANYYETSLELDPSGPSQGSSRVIRGGGWQYDASECRSACRSSFEPDGRANYLGFRVARSSPSTSSQRAKQGT